MIRKLWLGLILALFVCVLASGTASQATTCRRLTVWIAEDPYFSHPICFNMPGPLDQVSSQANGTAAATEREVAKLIDALLPPR